MDTADLENRLREYLEEFSFVISSKINKDAESFYVIATRVGSFGDGDVFTCVSPCMKKYDAEYTILSSFAVFLETAKNICWDSQIVKSLPDIKIDHSPIVRAINTVCGELAEKNKHRIEQLPFSAFDKETA